MQKAGRDKNYVKVFILYLLWNIDMPLDFATVNDIMIQDGYVGYFDFAECFGELLDDGHISEETGEDGTAKYRITESGRHVAENLSGDIFEEIRDKSLKSALRLLSFRERKAELSFSCDEIPEDNGGGFEVTCEIKEHGSVTCSVTLRVDVQSRADAIRKNFYEHPEAIYRGAVALLLGDVNYIL